MGAVAKESKTAWQAATSAVASLSSAVTPRRTNCVYTQTTYWEGRGGGGAGRGVSAVAWCGGGRFGMGWDGRVWGGGGGGGWMLTLRETRETVQFSGRFRARSMYRSKPSDVCG